MPVTIQFAINLRNDTTTTAFVRATRPWGWLAAPKNTTAGLRLYVVDKVRPKRAFVVDNGNFERITKVKKVFAGRAGILRKEVDRIEKVLKRTADRADFPPTLSAAWDTLALDVSTAATTNVYDARSGLAAQIVLSPSHVIGAEDITMAALLSVDAEPRYLNWTRAQYRTMNRRTARKAASVLAASPRGPFHYAVASALDYNSAFDAGHEFARAGLTRVAMGFGAYMADDHYTDHLVVHDRRISFGERWPQRYLRTVVVALGFIDGYRAFGGPRLTAFHFLGLGHPILMGLVALIARGTPCLTFDAMSPIKDAVEGTLYVTKPSFLKIRTRKVADRMSREDVTWDCPCPFCRQFHRTYPPNYADARAWRRAHPDSEVDKVALQPGGSLFAALPLLSEPRGGPFRRVVNDARIGHNHWVLTKIVRELERHQRRKTLVRYMEKVVDTYAQSALPHLGRAVRYAHELARRGVGK